MTERRRVLIVVNDAAFFLSHRLALALGARDAGFDVHVATPRDAASPQIVAHGLSFHPIPLSRRGTSPVAELSTLAALVKLYRSVEPDLVHHVTAKAILWGGLAARIARVPAVVHAVSGLGYIFIAESRKARAMRAALRIAYRTATAHPNCAVIFQNEDDRNAFADVIRTSRIVFIQGSGVDLERFRVAPLPTDGIPIVVLPSRMLWDKGVGEFVDAARSLLRRGVAARFVLAGGLDPANPAAIAPERLTEWTREGVVEWWGHREDMPEVLALATLVCLPSYREGMPKALLEACALGRPIVTTDVPGCRDVLGGGTFGVLVPARNSEALAGAIAQLLSEPARLERMAGEAALRGSEFSVDAVVDRTIALYRELLH
jgi:glycosyltransferase involved in cell wall biosynthesis